MPPRKSQPTPVVTYTHAEARANIPTHELRDFVDTKYEATPQVVRYPRDPALDPQLVWKGKEEQDSRDLTVEVVPIYIQEKIHPQALVEELKNAGEAQPQLDLFAGYDAIEDFGEKVEFYQHEEKWQNRMILGDSLVVMTSLAEKEGLKGKVQTIYIDPPYGIKFGSNWQVSTRKRDVKDGKAEDATRQPEQVRAFRDTWQLGIHSYLAYLRDRLTVAREVLTESGSIFVQIGDENVHIVRSIMDEVFGSENYVSSIIVHKTAGKASGYLDTVYDVILWYGKSEEIKYRQIFSWKTLGEEGTTQYVNAVNEIGADIRLSTQQRENSDSIPREWRVFASDNLTSQSASSTTLFSYPIDGRTVVPGSGGWKTNTEGMNRLNVAGRLKLIGNTMMYRRFVDDFPVSPISNVWRDVLMTGFSDEKVYVVQSGTRMIERCLLMTTDPGDLVLDPTCGSGTTAYVAEQWGRRWITVDTSRVALALARTRLMAAKYPYYLLADSPEGVAKEGNISGITPPPPQKQLAARYPQGLCLQARPARYSQVDCQQCTDRRDSCRLPGRSGDAAHRTQRRAEPKLA